MSLPHQARLFATAAHRAIDQKRKYTGECYTVHLKEVAEIVKGAGGSQEMIAAAWLHDTVEDTGVSIADVHQFFGPAVAELVDWLTDVSKPEDGNRKTRKALDRDHLAKAPADAQTIKLADLISNSASILEKDPGFAKVYLAEARELLAVLTLGDKTLHARAQRQVDGQG